MKELAKQLGSWLGAAFAAACCLGFAAALSVLTAIGAGFLIHDAFLIPLYVVLLTLSLWLLYRSSRAHGRLWPFWVGVCGAVAGFVGLWVSPIVVYAGLVAIMGANLADFLRGHRPNAARS